MQLIVIGHFFHLVVVNKCMSSRYFFQIILYFDILCFIHFVRGNVMFELSNTEYFRKLYNCVFLV